MENENDNIGVKLDSTLWLAEMNRLVASLQESEQACRDDAREQLVRAEVYENASMRLRLCINNLTANAESEALT